jgi:hypothetical protein
MAQTFTEDSFAAAHVGLTDLQNMENNFLALKTLFSGSSAPSDSTGGMPWFDTGKKILKIRNSANSAWLGVHYSSTAARWWVYANTAGDGWIVDSSVADRVLSVKGGSNAYNTAGGGGAGTWTYAGSTVGSNSTSHTHTVPNHTHTFASIYVIADSTIDPGGQNVFYSQNASGSTVTGIASASHIHTISYANTWRPLASVGTLQYIDL